MRAKIKSFQSVDIEDLPNFIPDNPENFAFLLELTVGADNKEGGDLFDIQVCTPIWFLSNMKKEDIIIGRHFLIVLEYNFERIFNKVRKLVETCT